MPIQAPRFGQYLIYSIAILSGILFTFIAGYLDTADYLVEQWSIWIIEIPFIVFWSVLSRKTGWKLALQFVLVGTALTFGLTFQDKSITSLVYLKASLTGVILGDPSWFSKTFSRRLTAVSLPGLVFAFVFGLPVIIKGVTPEIMERFRNDALEMYNAFMTEEEAINAADNAMQMFRWIFQSGFAVFTISALIYSWLSFSLSKFVMVKFNETPEATLPFHYFKVPFHFIWAFLISFGLLLAEFEPLSSFAINIFVISCFLYFVQGLAIVMFHMNRLSLGRLPRIAFWLITFFTLVFSGIFLIFTGVLDNWFVLRHAYENTTNNNSINSDINEEDLS